MVCVLVIKIWIFKDKEATQVYIYYTKLHPSAFIFTPVHLKA